MPKYATTPLHPRQLWQSRDGVGRSLPARGERTAKVQPMVGRVFMGRYQVIRLLGEGGMGKVYLAKQLDLDRQVVVKVMHDHIAADPVFCDRFKRETELMARFTHSYAVTLYDA